MVSFKNSFLCSNAVVSSGKDAIASQEGLEPALEKNEVKEELSSKETSSNEDKDLEKAPLKENVALRLEILKGPEPPFFDSLPWSSKIIAPSNEENASQGILAGISLPEIATREQSPSFEEKTPPKKKELRTFPYPQRIALSHTEGYGEHKKTYRTNYSLAEVVFAPDAQEGSILPMIDFRGYRFDNAKYAISTGLGLRYIPTAANTRCNIFGVNVYYDYAPDTPGYHQQFGAGIEILGKRLDFRANIFTPFGKDQSCGICCDRECVNGWLSSGYNAEVGYLLYEKKSFSLYTAAGPYYVTACKCKERQRGGMVRVFPQYKDFVGLNLKYSYDPLFRSIFQAELVISLPYYQLRNAKQTSCGISNRQIYKRVERR